MEDENSILWPVNGAMALESGRHDVPRPSAAQGRESGASSRCKRRGSAKEQR